MNSLVTTDHKKIQKWAEEREGKPAIVKGTESKDSALLRIDFPGYSGEDRLAEIEWEEWFRIFDENELAFLYQDKTAGGKQSRFSKLVNRKEENKK